MGGRSQQLNKALATEGAYLLRPLLDVLGREDKLGLFTYDDSLHTMVDFDDTHDKWDGALDSFNTPHFSETNFCKPGRRNAAPRPTMKAILASRCVLVK